MKLKSLALFILLLAASFTANAGKISPADSAKFAEYEVELKRLSYYTMNFPFEKARQDASDSLERLLAKVLDEPNSFYYPFDSMQTVSRIVTEDKKLRFFTWSVIDNNGNHSYHGFIEYNPDNFKDELPHNYVKLNSNAPKENILFEQLNADNWCGALYYQVKKYKYKKNEYYVLIGYNGSGNSMNIKLMDVLSLDDNYNPVFGADIFFMGKDYKNAVKEYKEAQKEAKKYEDDPIRQSSANNKAVAPLFHKRVLFYCADDVVMTLRFENDGEFVIWDHLVPVKGDIGEFSKYYPDGTYDYVKYKKGVFFYNELFFSNEKIK